MRVVWCFLIMTLIGLAVFVEAMAQLGTEPIPPILKPTQLQPMCPSQDLCTTSADATILVPHQAPTIQQAIDRLAVKGTVVVTSGTYRENIRIPEGRHVVIKSAAGSQETRLRPWNVKQPTITVEPGAKACISGLEIQGGSVGILAGEFLAPTPGQNLPTQASFKVIGTTPFIQPTEQLKLLRRLGRPAAALAVRDVKLIAGDRGILGFADRIEVCGGEAEGCGWGAVLIGREVLVRALWLFANAGGLGVLNGALCSGPIGVGEIVTESVTIDGLYANFNEGPGLVICGAQNVRVRDSSFTLNGIANVYVFNSNDVELENIGAYYASPIDGKWGDGVIVVDSSVEVTDSNVGSSYRAGIYYNSSGGAIRNNYIFNNKFAVALEGGADPSVPVCVGFLPPDCNVFFGNDRNEVVVGQGLEPPPAPEPVQD